MANFSDIIYNTHGLKSPPAIANAKMMAENQECGAVLYRSSDEQWPSEPPPWQNIFTRFNKTALMGSPESYGGDTGFLWAEKNQLFSSVLSYTVAGKGEDETVVCHAPLQVASAGITLAQTDYGTQYKLYINGQFISFFDVCPLLYTFPYGFGLVTLERMTYNGYKTNYIFVSQLITFTKYGQTRGGVWTYNIAGMQASDLPGWGRPAENVSSVELFDTNDHYIRTVAFHPEDGGSNLPAVHGRDGTISPKNAYIYPWNYGSISNRRDTSSYVRASLNIANRFFYWCPTVISVTWSPFFPEQLEDIRYWTYNPLREGSSSNAIESGAKFLALYPLTTSSMGDTFSNWGIYLSNESNNNHWCIRNYQDGHYLNSIDLGITAYTSSSATTLVDYRVSVSYDVFKRPEKPLNIYLIFYKFSEKETSRYYTIKDEDCFMLKCSFSKLKDINDNFSSMTIERIDLNKLFTLNHPLVPGTYYLAPIKGYQKNHIITYDINTYRVVTETYENPPSNNEQWGYLWGKTGNLDSYYFDYNGGYLVPFGGKYLIWPGSPVAFNKWIDDGTNPGHWDIWNTGDVYDLQSLIIDLDNIQGSLDYMNR